MHAADAYALKIQHRLPDEVRIAPAKRLKVREQMDVAIVTLEIAIRRFELITNRAANICPGSDRHSISTMVSMLEYRGSATAMTLSMSVAWERTTMGGSGTGWPASLLKSARPSLTPGNGPASSIQGP